MIDVSVSARYNTYTPDDKVAFKELREYAQKATGRSVVPLKDILFAVEPGLPTPEYLVGV